MDATPQPHLRQAAAAFAASRSEFYDAAAFCEMKVYCIFKQFNILIRLGKCTPTFKVLYDRNASTQNLKKSSKHSPVFAREKLHLTKPAYDSVAPLVSKIYEIDGLHDCDITDFFRKPADFIRQNQDNQVCMMATMFPEEMIDILDKEYGLNCDTVFSRENIDVTFYANRIGSYPETAISLCKQAVAEIKEYYPRFRN